MLECGDLKLVHWNVQGDLFNDIKIVVHMRANLYNQCNEDDPL